MPRPRRRKAQAMAATQPKPSEVGEIEIANPFRLRAPDLKISPVGEIRYVEDRITVVRTLRDDQLVRLHHRRHISESMYRAGRHWQRLYAEAAIGRIGSSGDIKEPVDGSRVVPDPFTPKQQRAMRQLLRIHDVLGADGYLLIRDLLGENLSYGQIAQKYHHPPDYTGRRIRECLASLAKQLGYCT